jgi:hypothetical protein
MMTSSTFPLGQLPDGELLAQVSRAVQDERRATAHLVALLIELDARRLFLGEGFSSLFTYCTQALHLSEHAAYNRIEAARAARRFPVVLDLFAEGAVTLTSIRLLAPHLTLDNHRDVLARARHKCKRDVELLVADLNPRPDVPSVIRKLPTMVAIAGTSSTGSVPVAESENRSDPSDARRSPDNARHTVPTSRRAEVKPLAPGRYKIQLTVSRQTYETLQRARDLLRHSVPDGDPAAIFERALALLVTELERKKPAAVSRPKPNARLASTSRHIPAAVKRTVWKRDGGQCAFSGMQGRCTETSFLEYHHVMPFAAGGDTSAANLELRCRAHNQYDAECHFGRKQPPLFREKRSVYGAFRNSFRNESVSSGHGTFCGT